MYSVQSQATADGEVRAWLSLGANLGDARQTLCSAMAAMNRWPHTRLAAASSLYRTAPDYINAVVEVQTSLLPQALLQKCREQETAAGRERPYRHAPRTLDIDILLYGDRCVNLPELIVPHPRMLQRAFVLVPLAEIAPVKVTAEQLQAVASQRIERLTDCGSPFGEGIMRV